MKGIKLMKNFGKIGCSIIAMLMLATISMTGCTKITETGSSSASASKVSSESSNAIDTSKAVVLKMYLLGDKPVDFDLVYGELNKKLQEKINTTLDIKYISWADFTQKYPLLFATGEDFDMVFTATWANYKANAVKNAFAELTPELLNKYAPETMKEVPSEAWKQVTVNNKIYAFPATNLEFGVKLAVIRGDLREKYNIPPITTFDQLENYLFTIAEKEKTIIPYDVGQSGLEILSAGYYQANETWLWDDAYTATKYSDPEAKVFSALDDPQLLAWYKRMKVWKDKGVIPSDAASKKLVMQESFEAGKSAMFVWNLTNLGIMLRTVNQIHPEYKAELVNPFPESATYPQQFNNAGMCIKNGSKNIERAIMVEELLRNDKALFDLSNYGIKDKHWVPMGDDKFVSLPNSKNFAPNANCQWGWNSKLLRQPGDMIDSYYSIYDNWAKHQVPNYMVGFAMDITNVKNEAASFANLLQLYAYPLSLGAYDDPEKYLNEWKAKLQTAGYDKYLKEFQVQAKEYSDSLR